MFWAFISLRLLISWDGMYFLFDVVSLLSLCLAAIESQQRSVGKQFAALFNTAAGKTNSSMWMCSFDVRAARELDLDASITKGGGDDMDVCFAHLLRYFVDTNVVGDNSSKGGGGDAKQPPVLSVGSSSTIGPIDVSHMILLIIRSVLGTMIAMCVRSWFEQCIGCALSKT